MRRKCDSKEGDLNWAHPFPRVSRYKRERVTITEGDITKVSVYIKKGGLHWLSPLAVGNMPGVGKPAPASCNEQGEPTASYRWTGWVWEITSWRSRLQENNSSVQRNLWNAPEGVSGKPEDHNMYPVAVIREISEHNRFEIPGVCKSNRLHVDILRFWCIELGYIL